MVGDLEEAKGFRGGFDLVNDIGAVGRGGDVGEVDGGYDSGSWVGGGFEGRGQKFEGWK